MLKIDLTLQFLSKRQTWFCQWQTRGSNELLTKLDLWWRQDFRHSGQKTVPVARWSVLQIQRAVYNSSPNLSCHWRGVEVQNKILQPKRSAASKGWEFFNKLRRTITELLRVYVFSRTTNWKRKQQNRIKCCRLRLNIKQWQSLRVFRLDFSISVPIFDFILRKFTQMAIFILSYWCCETKRHLIGTFQR